MAETKKKTVTKKKKVAPPVTTIAEETVAPTAAEEQIKKVESETAEKSSTEDLKKAQDLSAYHEAARKQAKQDAAKPVPEPIVVHEFVTFVSNGTPTKDLACSILKAFEENPGLLVTVTLKCIGAGTTHQATKGVMEANRILMARGKLLSRFDFWTVEDGDSAGGREGERRSVNNIRLIMCDLLPVSLGSALAGFNVTYAPIGTGRERQ